MSSQKKKNDPQETRWERERDPSDEKAWMERGDGGREGGRDDAILQISHLVWIEKKQKTKKPLFHLCLSAPRLDSIFGMNIFLRLGEGEGLFWCSARPTGRSTLEGDKIVKKNVFHYSTFNYYKEEYKKREVFQSVDSHYFESLKCP